MWQLRQEGLVRLHAMTFPNHF
uniref:Uncharacterized protein n=1 Tax=Rhizophora mucronata TaxID=61149 RepID=A0A2P2NDY0_RHIMU